MSSESIQRADGAFQRARSKAFLRDVWAHLQRRPNRLLPYDEVRQRVRAGIPIYRGLETVPINKITGSVNRFQDFDRTFLPAQDFTRDRWKNIGRAFYDDVNLPPVQLYKVGDAYFVMDGNHRVSVARQMGREFIDAEVHECLVTVPVSPDLTADALVVIGEQADFLAQTRLNETRPEVDIRPTLPGGYHLLLEHIEVHRHLQSQEWKRDFDFEEAAAQWVDQVYLPMVHVIRETEILEEFPGRTEADLYVWVMDHLYYLRERMGEGANPRLAARSFAEQFTSRFLKRFWNWFSRHILRRPARPDDMRLF